ncbi:hypothetical protein GQX73_g9002 [Xylaria multiplex]|uniref:Uncharacterized protein n=1 Tax=Xylaria multiplex TaxID=323545 RepID=A0A7C8MKD6_9PEZI|nr:hypothetical protein GQX73_g9002 [Xylaria multiplex]
MGAPPISDLINDLINNSASSRNILDLSRLSREAHEEFVSSLECEERRPNDELRQILGYVYDRRGDDNENSEIDESPSELAVPRVRAAQSSPLLLEKEDDCHDSQDGYDDDGVIESKFGIRHVLSLVSTWLASAIDQAILAWVRWIAATVLGQQWDECDKDINSPCDNEGVD